MTWKRNILVVTNVTATSDALLEDLRRRAQREPTTVTLLVPATSLGGGQAAALEQLGLALEQLRAAGIAAEGSVGDADPIVAVSEAWDPKRYDEILVSTLPATVSTWLHAGLPERIAKLTGASVTHIVSSPPKPPLHTVAPPPHKGSGVVQGAFTWLGVKSEPSTRL